jgi:hypothetical protein
LVTSRGGGSQLAWPHEVNITGEARVNHCTPGTSARESLQRSERLTVLGTPKDDMPGFLQGASLSNLPIKLAKSPLANGCVVNLRAVICHTKARGESRVTEVTGRAGRNVVPWAQPTNTWLAKSARYRSREPTVAVPVVGHWATSSRGELRLRELLRAKPHSNEPPFLLLAAPWGNGLRANGITM